jgi:Homeodomain-like domain
VWERRDTRASVRRRFRGERTEVLIILERCINNRTGTDGLRAVGRSPRTISYRSPLAEVLLSLQSPTNSDAAIVSNDDTPVFPPQPQRRPGPATPRRGIPREQWPDVLRRIEQGDSLRQIAKSYGVSYETVRRVVRTARQHGREGR